MLVGLAGALIPGTVLSFTRSTSNLNQHALPMLRWKKEDSEVKLKTSSSLLQLPHNYAKPEWLGLGLAQAQWK